MANARIFYDNMAAYSDVTITAGSEADDLPVENIVHPHRQKVYRTGTASAAETILFDLQSAKAVQVVVILDHDMTASDTLIKLQGNATDSWGTPSVDEAITWNAGVMILVLGAAQTYRYWRVVFTKSAAGETRDIGYVFLGPLYECVKHVDFGGLEVEPVDLSETDRAHGGVTYSEEINSFNRIKADFSYVAQTQKDAFDNLDAACGTHTPFFVQFSPDYLSYDSLFFVKAAKLKSRKVEILKSGAYLWSTSMELNEEI